MSPERSDCVSLITASFSPEEKRLWLKPSSVGCVSASWQMPFVGRKTSDVNSYGFSLFLFLSNVLNHAVDTSSQMAKQLTNRAFFYLLPSLEGRYYCVCFIDSDTGVPKAHRWVRARPTYRAFQYPGVTQVLAALLTGQKHMPPHDSNDHNLTHD